MNGHGSLFQYPTVKMLTYFMSLSKGYPRENVTKTPSGAELPRVFWSHFPSVFLSDSNVWPGMINPDYDISVYNNMFNYLSWIILIFPQITGFSTSRWEDKVTATKIKGLRHSRRPSWEDAQEWINKASVHCFFCVSYWERLWHVCLQ